MIVFVGYIGSVKRRPFNGKVLLDCLAGNAAHDVNSKLQAFAVDVICEAFESLAIGR